MNLKTGTMLADDDIKELILSQTANGIDITSGIDSIEYCKDPSRYRSYNKLVMYQYNYMGYRDEDWPEDLLNNIWSVGDSFTVGLGQPLEETWPKLLSKKLNQRIINVSMNGASNDWIARRATYILTRFAPKVLLIQWSYLHRREDTNTDLLDEFRAIWHATKHVSDDLENFLQNLNNIESVKGATLVVHSFIPEFYSRETQDDQIIYQTMSNINATGFPPCKQVDYSRDGHHYDIETATCYAEKYYEQIK